MGEEEGRGEEGREETYVKTITLLADVRLHVDFMI